MIDARWINPVLAAASERLAAGLHLADLVHGSTVWLAVTGLSRSGKTVFITSLIHNLLSAVHNPARMPLLQAVGEGRLISARIEAAGAHLLPRFPYRGNIEKMAGAAPDWPARTTDISEIGIELHFTPAGLLGRMLGRISDRHATLRLRIVDYPGEWLIDLPLLGQSYADWSRATLQLYGRGLRASIARDFLAFVAQHRHDEPASEATARQAHDLYCAFLRQARDRHGLHFLQPGRFLFRGNLGDPPYLWFAPLAVPDGSEPRPNTLGGLMAERFEVYKREVVAAFYQQHFRHYGRQIVLVDVLGALLAGREAFEDTRLALDAILQSFRHGPGSMLSRLLRGPQIDKVLFGATKADHVPDAQREHLALLLRNMAAFKTLDLKISHTAIEVTALASVISTAEDTQEIDGQRVQVVVGRPVGTGRQAKFFVGNVPIRPPRPEAWNVFLNVPVFEPPSVEAQPVEGIAHIGLDQALEFLLGDRLR
jgi:predicted YcjX-like family ATPase